VGHRENANVRTVLIEHARSPCTCVQIAQVRIEPRLPACTKAQGHRPPHAEATRALSAGTADGGTGRAWPACPLRDGATAPIRLGVTFPRIKETL
jgi:hypothetical protein